MKIKNVILASALLLPIAGCATWTDASYSNKPITANDKATMKKGTSYCFGMFGDCTDSAAALDGGISEIVATEKTSYLMAITKTTAYGK